jgi:hypothetical protein
MVFLSSHIPLSPMGHQFKIMLLENEGNVEFSLNLFRRPQRNRRDILYLKSSIIWIIRA